MREEQELLTDNVPIHNSLQSRSHEEDEEDEDYEQDYDEDTHFTDEARLSGETTYQFIMRHYHNFVHFFVEDWFLSAILALLMSILSIWMDVAIEYLHHIKLLLYDQAMKMSEYMGCLLWVSYIAIYVTSASIFCDKVSKQSIGSGIPEMKVIIQGFHMRNYLSMKTLIAKVVGLTVALGGGMPTGKEGPFVHIGAILASLLTKLTRGCRYNAFFTNEGRQLEMLSTGCAVGIACTFSAPAGAVLYGIESTSKYFAVKHYWKQFFATTCAALIFRFGMNYIVPAHIAGTILAYYQTHFPNEVFVVEEVPFFALLGLLCGIAGALFIWVHRQIALFRRRNSVYQKIFGQRPVFFTAFVAIVYGLITFPSGIGRFIAGKYVLRETLVDFISNCTMTATNRSKLLCPDEMINHWTADGTVNYHPWLSLAIYVTCYFFIVAVCTSLHYPAGIFVPAFVIGACGGRILGELLSLWFPEGFRGVEGTQIYPGLYAVVGAAAFTGAVTHSLSIAVIVCETTGQLCAGLPVLVALMVGNAMCAFLQPSFYESLIKINNYPYLAELPPSRMSVFTLKVEQIMVKEIVFITRSTTYKQLYNILLRTPKLRSYPYVTDTQSCIIIGSVSRRYLENLLEEKLGKSHQFTFPRRGSMRFTGIVDRRNSTIESMLDNQVQTMMRRNNSMESSKEDHILEINRKAIDSAPFQLVKGTNLHKVHTLFSLLNLSHAYVTERGRLVGLVAVRELREALNDIYIRGAVPVDR